MATDPNQFANVQLSDNFNTWRTRTNQIAAAMSSNTFTVANTVHANGAAKAITTGHGILNGSISSGELYANVHISGGEYSRKRTLTIASNTHITGRTVVANDAVFGLNGEEEVLLNSRLLAEANATFRDTVRMDADVHIGLGNLNSLTVNSIARFNSNVHIDGDTISITGNTQIGGANTDTFIVNAVSTFDADVAFRDEVTLSANVLMSGANVVITGDTNTQDVTSTTLRVDGTTLVANDGASTFTVGGPTRILNTTHIEDTLNVTGATSLNGTTLTTLAANGTSSLNGVTATTIQANGTLDVGGATTLNGAVTLGDATADDLTFTGRVASSVLPKTTNTYSLGSSSLTYSTVHTGMLQSGSGNFGGNITVSGNAVISTGLYADTIQATGLIDAQVGVRATNFFDATGAMYLGTDSNDTLEVAATTTFNSDVDFDGDQTNFTGDVAFTGDEVVIDSNLTIGTDFILTATEGRYANLEISNTSIFEGNVVFGVVNGNPLTRVTFTSNVGSDILPHATGSYDLGSSTKKWEDIHSSGTINYTNMVASSSTGTVTFPKINSHFIPNTTNTYDLGSSTKQWKNLYVDGTGSIDNILSSSVTTSTLVAQNPGNFTVGGATIQQYGRAQINATDNGGDGSLTYSSTNGTISYVGPSATETRAHFSASNSGTGYGSLSYASGIFTFQKVTSANIRGNFRDDVANTAAVTFGSLNYYTGNGAIQLVPVERREVRGSISATNSGSGYGSISYNNDTGIITYTKVTSGNVRGLITDKVANTEANYFGSLNYYSSNGVIELVPVNRSQVRGSLSGSTGVSYSSTTGAISIGQDVGTADSPTFGGQTINGTASMRTITVQADSTYNIGSSTAKYNTIYATTFSGTATKARYADLAEKYLADQTYATGTVVCVGGTAEVTASTGGMAHAVVGVVSENPAYMMNSELEGGTYIALKGRVPVKIEGSVTKGAMLAAGDEGRAVAFDNAGRPFAVALEDGSYDTETETGTDTIEAFIM